jgi:hypothetical protein
MRSRPVCPPFSTKLEISYDPRQKVTPPHFTLSRIIAGTSFALAYPYSTTDNEPGSLRVTFTRVR